MSGEPTDMHTASTDAPKVSELVARCVVCGAQWQVRGDSDVQGCKFCDAPGGRGWNSAIEIIPETPVYRPLSIR